MKKLILSLAVVLSFSPTLSHARNFYRITEKLDLTYTNIRSGTVQLIKGLPIEVRVSDDLAFCVVVFPKFEAKCTVKSGTTGGYNSWMLKTEWAALFSYLEKEGHIGYDDNLKLGRILSACTGNTCNYFVTTTGTKLEYQIDDTVPEAFHLTIYDILKPVKM